VYAALALQSSCEAGRRGQSYLLSRATRLPDDLKHASFIDFGSKLVLVGYDVSPDDKGGPRTGGAPQALLEAQAGSSTRAGVSSRHLEDDRGRQIGNFDREGAFRGALGKTDGRRVARTSERSTPTSRRSTCRRRTCSLRG